VAKDLEREPVAGADPTRPAPGVGPHEADPAAMALTGASAPEGTPDGVPSTASESTAPAARSPRATNAGRVWVAIAVATVLLILLIIFIAENSRSVTISFLGLNGHISLALALLIAAVVGVAVTLLAGTARILQLRLEVRRSRAGRGHPQPD
jgi:putative membrane protein